MTNYGKLRSTWQSVITHWLCSQLLCVMNYPTFCHLSYIYIAYFHHHVQKSVLSWWFFFLFVFFFLHRMIISKFNNQHHRLINCSFVWCKDQVNRHKNERKRSRKGSCGCFWKVICVWIETETAMQQFSCSI